MAHHSGSAKDYDLPVEFREKWEQFVALSDWLEEEMATWQASEEDEW